MPGRFFLLLCQVFFIIFPAACMPEIRNPYDPKTDEFWIVQAVRCNLLGECTELCELPSWQATAAVAGDASYFYSVASDASCNAYVVGVLTTGSSATTRYRFGDMDLTAKAPTASQQNSVILKYAPNGQVLWAKTAVSAASTHIFYDLALDRYGNAYAVGYLTGNGNFDFGTGNISGPTSANHALIVKYAPDGRTLWAKTIENTLGTGSSVFASVAVNEAGEVFAVGYITTPTSGSCSPSCPVTYTFSSGVTAATPYADANSARNAVIVKYNAATGAALLAKTATTAPNESEFAGVAARGGFVHAVGKLWGQSPPPNFDFDGQTVTPGLNGSWNAGIIKYDTNLMAQAAKSTASGTTNESGFSDVAVDASGNAYAAGYVTPGTFNFGSGNIMTSGTASNYALLVRYNTDGSIGTNLASPGSNSYDSQYASVAVGPLSERLYLSGGLVGGPLSFSTNSASVTLTGANSSQFNAFYLSMALDGSTISGRTTTQDPNGSSFDGIAVDPLGRIHVAGKMLGSGKLDFGLGGITVSGSYNYPVWVRY